MKKSIGDNMIPKEWSFELGLELVKKAGYEGIELWLGDMQWFQMGTTDGQVTELRRKAENAGLVVSNVSTGLHWATQLSARDPGVRARAVRIVEREIETAQLLGCDAVLVVAGLVTEDMSWAKDSRHTERRRQDADATTSVVILIARADARTLLESKGVDVRAKIIGEYGERAAFVLGFPTADREAVAGVLEFLASEDDFGAAGNVGGLSMTDLTRGRNSATGESAGLEGRESQP
jgi:sugar phosphate isomerase/epimerase